MQWIDDRVFAAVEWFAHRFQRLTGKTNFWLARMFCLPLLTMLLLVGVNGFVRILPSPMHPVLAVFVGVIGIPYFAWLMHRLRQLEDPTAFLSGTLPGWLAKIREPDRARPLFVILGCLLFVADVVCILTGSAPHLTPDRRFVHELYLFGLYAYPTLWYLLSVDPLPPGTSKVQEWLEQLKTAFAPARPKEATIPVR